MRYKLSVIASLILGLLASVLLTSVAPVQPVQASTRHFMRHGASAQCTTSSRTSCRTDPTVYPRSVAACQAEILLHPSERISANATANHTTGPANTWGPWATQNAGIWPDYWSKATGQFTGTTDELMEMAACRWGWNEDWIRAEAVRESSWRESARGDFGNGCYHSFSIMQIRDSRQSTCPLNHNAWGGMPTSQKSTPTALDAFGSYMRSCVDGRRGTTFYRGQTVSQIAAVHGWTYVRWGCVGSWYSGDWYSSAAQGYIDRVKTALANRTWETY
jgi:hypothetical protein